MKRINTDDEELDSFLFSLGCYAGEPVTTYLSMKAPVFIAPAMDLDMYAHPSTVHNIETLEGYGNRVIEATAGEFSSHLSGKGRMEEPENIVNVLKDFFLAGSELCGKRILITAGPTYEKIDPVRFIGNYSSGKMGFLPGEYRHGRVCGPCAGKTGRRRHA